MYVPRNFSTLHTFILTSLQKQDASPEADSSQGQKKVSKAERKAKHAEANKQLWESAYIGPSYSPPSLSLVGVTRCQRD